jgi:carboxyl-terminal processing protease
LTTAKYYTPSGRLIQREYEGLSLYDYYFNRDDKSDNGQANTKNKEVKVTDSGRTVYGGGGITPDEKVATPKLTKFQTHLLQKYAFFNFAKHYMIGKHIDKNFQVDDSVMQEFRKFMDAQKIDFTEKDLMEANDWVRSNIKAEIFTSEFGQEQGQRVRAETDPQVLKALDFLPKAKELADNAHRIVAERTQARSAGQNR